MEKNNNRTIYFTAAVVVVIVAVALVIWYQFFRDDAAVVNLNTTTITNDTNVAVVNATVNATPTVSDADLEQKSEALQVERLAKLFTERFGSYSTDAQYQNILDLRPYMTNKMRVWAEDYVTVQIARGDEATLNRIVTIVVSTQEQSIAGTRVSMRLTTQRVESGVTEESYYQEIELDFIKGDEGWLVDSATWQEKGVITLPEAEESTNTDTTVDLSNTNSEVSE